MKKPNTSIFFLPTSSLISKEIEDTGMIPYFHIFNLKSKTLK
jgi:hypothetical protein